MASPNQLIGVRGPLNPTDNTSETYQQTMFKQSQPFIGAPGRINTLVGNQFFQGYLTRGQVIQYSAPGPVFNPVLMCTRRNSLRKVVPVIPLDNINKFNPYA